MKTKIQPNITQWMVLPFLAGVFWVLMGMPASATEIDLSTPDSTVLGYCRGAGEKVQAYFHEYYEPVDPKIFGYPTWTDCKIIGAKKTDIAGKEFHNGISAEFEERSIDPRLLKKDLALERNAKKFTETLFTNPELSKVVFKGIESGKKEWLEIYPIIRSNTDAMNTLILDTYLGYSIKNNPDMALQMIYEGGAKTKIVCGDVWESWSEEDLKRSMVDSAIKEFRQRLKAVSEISDNFIYKQILSECQIILEKRLEFWKNASQKFN